MSELIVIGFEDKFTAEEVRLKLLKMQKDYLIDLEDAVVAVKNEKGKIKLNQIYHLTSAGAISGTFWGSLIGLIFYSPLIGAAIGATAGAITGSLSDVGINDDFMKSLSQTLEPGTSALFVLVRSATPDKVLESLRLFKGRVLKTSLTHEDEDRLKGILEKTELDKPLESQV